LQDFSNTKFGRKAADALRRVNADYLLSGNFFSIAAQSSPKVTNAESSSAIVTL
jgi:hypothetical protein